MSNQVLDLDIIRPLANIVKINNKEFDLSFIPVGITFEVDDLVERLRNLDHKKLEAKEKDEIRKAFDLSIDIGVTLLSFYDPSCNKEWFMKSVNPAQVEQLVMIIRGALEDSYKGIKRYGKN